MKLIAGLGNPGTAYDKTPHNMGFAVVDCLAERMGVRLRPSRQIKALVAEGTLAGESVMLLKPTTFMNLSGQAVAPLVMERRLQPQEIFVLVDDADLPLGSLRWRSKGGDGGHKGLRSMIQELERDDFVRLRIGVQPEERPEDLETYVLEPFDSQAARWAGRIAEIAAESVEAAIGHGIDSTANRYNGYRVPEPAGSAKLS